MVLGALYFSFGTMQVAYGSPSQFTAGAASTSDHNATTTYSYLTPGTGTTTIVYDTQQSNGTNQTNNGNTYATDKVTFLEYVAASSTSSVFVTNFEYSQDGTSWYADSTNVFAAGAIAIATPNSYTYTYASTTPGGGAALSNSNTGARAITIDVPTRYVRAVMSITGVNGAVHGRFVPLKEVRP